jgi:PST family polysaccharide transporter
MLERELDYRKVAGLETGGKLLYHSTAVLLAYFGWGFWGAVVGYILWQAWTTFGSWFLARYVPQWSWSWHSTKGMLKYGVGYSSSIWIYSLRSLVNPLLVGKYLGPEYVGYVSLTSRLVEVLGFVKAATFRLSMVVLGKVQDDLGRLRRGVEEALGLQALSMGAPLSVFALAAPTLLPSLIGPRWAPALQIYSFIALGYMLNALFGVHASVLYVRKRNREVIEAYGVYVLLFAVTAFLLIPALGIWGYGAAELIAIPAYGLLHRSVRKLFEFNYARATPWLIAFPPLLFYPNLGWPPGLALLLPALAIFFTPSARKQLSEYLSYLRPGLVDEQSNE